MGKGLQGLWKKDLYDEFKALPEEVRKNYGRYRVGAVLRQPESRGRAERDEKMPDRNLDECVTPVGLRMQSSRRPVALSMFLKMLNTATTTTSLRSMSDEVEAYADHTLGRRSLGNFTMIQMPCRSLIRSW